MSYWTRRQEQLKQAAEKDEAALKKRLSSFFDTEFKRLDKEIAVYYQKYGEDNVIAYRNLLQSLSDEDRMLLMERMDEFAKKYPQYANLMPVRESIYKLDRLQGLQYSVYMAEAEIAGYTNDQMTGYLTKLSQQGVNYGMETLGFGKNFYSVNSDVVKQFVDAPWCNGENFSTRIWNDTQKLAQYLNQDIAQGFARGDSYEKLVRDLRQRFGRVNRKDAYRLVFTEGTYVMAESSMQPFTEDFERYRLSPVMDGRTCPICRSLARQVFEIKDRQPGVNFPPIHPWCRCSWEIVVDDWDRWIDDYVAKHSGDAKRAERVEKHMTDNADDGIIKKTGSADFRKFETGEQINDFFYYDAPNKKGVLQKKKSQYGQWKKSLSAEQISDIRDYSAGMYEPLNSYLRKRNGWEEIDAEAMNKIKNNLTSAIERFEVKEPITVYRYTGTNTFATSDLSSLVGKEWNDPGFMSTSPSLEGVENAIGINKEILLQIDVPAGKGIGAYINDIATIGKDVEYEFILKNDTTLKIIEVDTSGDKPIIKTVVK